jgi:hypothetical protein
MIRVPIAIAVMFCLPHLAHAEEPTIPPADEQQRPDNNDLPDCGDGGVLPCFERVWVDGVQFEMDFFDLDVKTNPPTHNFYVVGPQTDTPQGTTPFLHDHVVGDHAGVFWHGFLAVCSAQGISSGACVTSAAQGDPPLARTVHGHKLTTPGAIESAARSGLIALIDTGAVLLAKIDRCADHPRRAHRR